MDNEPLVQWPELLLHYIEIAGAFLAIGAVGFRYGVVRRRSITGERAENEIFTTAAGHAAVFGLIGAILGAINLAAALPALAARQNVTIFDALTGSLVIKAWVVLSLLGVVGFGLAAQRREVGWPLAAVGVFGAILRQGLTGNLNRLVVPMHLLAGGLWIGTLFVLVVAGLALVLRDERVRSHRVEIAAGMIHRYSPLALGSGAVLVLFGVTTAWQHLKRLEALWTTPYGWALVTKLCAVAVVFGLGAWNWRRQRPRMTSDEGAESIRGSAIRELVAAGVVLLITGVLVSLPSPK